MWRDQTGIWLVQNGSYKLLKWISQLKFLLALMKVQWNNGVKLNVHELDIFCFDNTLKLLEVTQWSSPVASLLYVPM